MGGIYEEGIVVPQDYPQSLNWYIKAAEQGHEKAQTKLDMMHSEGKGVSPEDNKDTDDTDDTEDIIWHD